MIDDFGLAELGLGGNPALVELGLADILILVEVGAWLSNVLSGICKERFGLLELIPCAFWALSPWFGTARSPEAGGGGPAAPSMGWAGESMLWEAAAGDARIRGERAREGEREGGAGS